jgi:POT family proton-dependent oligopeptide transporter
MQERVPPQVRYIVSTEACERFSDYGLISILTLYLNKQMALPEEKAKEIVHVFKMGVYFLPLLGGWLADRWLGRYRTILSLSLFYCLGHGLLALSDGNLFGIGAGLTLIAVGAGGIKPCVSAFVGDQFPQDQRLLTKVYGLFYWSINLGAMFAFALVPYIRDRAGYRLAFGVPGIAMGVAALCFWAGSRLYVKVPSARAQPAPRSPAAPGVSTTRADGVSTRTALWRILVALLPVPVFWALYDQINTSWVFQGQRMQPFEILGFLVDAERFQSVSALLVLIWVPILTLWVYPLAERCGLRVTPLRRMGLGMIFAAASFVICAWIQKRIDGGERLSLSWQLAPYVVLELGEVLLSATGLEFAYGQAPPSMKSVVMSLWLLTTSVGNLLVAVFTNLNARYVHASGSSEFLFYAVLMLAVAGVFALMASRYQPSQPAAVSAPVS